MAALFSVFVKIIIVSLKRKWAHCISISFCIPSRGRRGVWYQALVLCFRTKVNAYYVCFDSEYRWLKGCGKQISLKKCFFFVTCIFPILKKKCNIWDVGWKSDALPCTSMYSWLVITSTINFLNPIYILNQKWLFWCHSQSVTLS